MQKHILVLPDGREISSGAPGVAIGSLTLTRPVNDGQNLTLGSACAAMVEVTLLNPEPGLMAAGDALTLYTQDASGNRTLQGIFLAEKPERPDGYTLKLTAYDRMVLLDKDLTGWLCGLAGWPYTLQELAEQVCRECGVVLETGDMENRDFPVAKFTAEGITGRQLLRWLGEASGCFVHADRQGSIRFSWYTPAKTRLGAMPAYAARGAYLDGCLVLTLEDARVTEADGILSLESPDLSLTAAGVGTGRLNISDRMSQRWCYAGGLQLADYAAAPVQKVQLRRDAQDVGTVYPADAPRDANTYIITGNPLLAAENADTLQPLAQTLYDRLHTVSYTPCTLQLPGCDDFPAGSIVTVTDTRGQQHTVLVMQEQHTASRLCLTGTGTAKRDASSATNGQTYRALSGKVLHLRTDVDGLLAENADTAGRLARLQLELDGIRGQVQSQTATGQGLQTQLTTLEQTAQSLHAAVQTIEQTGATKVTTAFGMTLDGSALTIRRSGSNIENRLDETGMQVLRDPDSGFETVMLRADARGVLATDVTVGNYLCIGSHARLEDYTQGTDTKRTACFFTGG